MKIFKVFAVVLFSLACAVSAAAQGIGGGNLSGRVYFNPNILKEQMKELANEVDKKLPELRREKIEEQEKEKGRALTDEEIAKIDEDLKKGKEITVALQKGITTAVTVEFKSEKDVVLTADMKVDDNLLKAAGIGWAKRKAIKLAIAASPSEKATYTVKDSLIIMNTGTVKKPELDTLLISADGKYLYGRIDENKPFKLTRTK